MAALADDQTSDQQAHLFLEQIVTTHRNLRVAARLAESESSGLTFSADEIEILYWYGHCTYAVENVARVMHKDVDDVDAIVGSLARKVGVPFRTQLRDVYDQYLFLEDVVGLAVPLPAYAEVGYRHTNSKGVTYYLNAKVVALRGGVRQAIYYFSKDRRGEAIQDLPAGFAVNENPRNGFLTVRRK
jgi:hypothetical protein